MIVVRNEEWDQKTRSRRSTERRKTNITISFWYVYLKGLHRGIDPSLPVTIEAHRLRRATSPRKTEDKQTNKQTISQSVNQSINQSNHPSIHPSIHPSRSNKERKERENGLFMRMVSAMSSALWPVAILSAWRRAAPRSRAWRRKTPQNVQLFFKPISSTILSIVQP